MNFTNAIKSFFSNYTNFAGRASRSEYWYAVLFLFLAYLATTALDALGGFGLAIGLFSLAVIIPSLSVSVRRLHDVGRSGWWVMLYFIPLAGLVPLYWSLQPTQGNNGYPY